MDKLMEEYYTYFLDKNEKQIASLPGLIPVSKGMGLRIHGYEGQHFTVESFNLKIDHPDKKPGLYVFVEEEAK